VRDDDRGLTEGLRGVRRERRRAVRTWLAEVARTSSMEAGWPGRDSVEQTLNSGESQGERPVVRCS